ncbi:hypothetical protein C1R06_06815 [Neisseria gonorrhoeae]|nr:hypothetical protein BZG33_03860 [Neisseria gonorrhoeae]ASQ72976.1 hypothetical protein BZG34_01940 [Neisseria gonorrhoeae]AZG32223.1 hypothetical protein EGH17_06675 [Neisseria gonorrhoeae]ROU26854.1 hypothetical protein EGO69_08875 [Neisseria gonorrhoeae]ROU82632.1 hypothetical protein EGP05_02885 [Neisseria gonorrhoeae]
MRQAVGGFRPASARKFNRFFGRSVVYSGLTKIRTRRRAAGSTDGTEPIRPVLQHLREPFPLSRGGATRTGFCSSAILC